MPVSQLLPKDQLQKIIAFLAKLIRKEKQQLKLKLK